MFSIVGIGIGYVIEKVVLKKIEKYAIKTAGKFDNKIITSLGGIVFTWIVILSFLIPSNYFTINETFTNYSNKICFSIIILSFTVLAGRIIVLTIKSKTANHSQHFPSATIILNIARITVLLIGLMLILQVFGVSIAPILTALGVGGLAVALALQETLSNLFSGIQITASKKIRNGDYIKLDSGEEGYVQDITWRNTIIKALQNNLIIIPNSKLSSVIITNYNFPDTELAVLVEVGVSYDSDLKLVEKVTIDVAKNISQLIEGGVKTFDPFIRYHTFSDSSINFTVIMRGHEFSNQFLIKHEFIKLLHQKYKENKIEIPYPIRTVYLK
jgi:small-conductance mechanosensitive channel